MFNVLLPKTNSAISHHIATSKVVVCFNPSAIECFHDKQCNETEMVVMKVGSDKTQYVGTCASTIDSKVVVQKKIYFTSL